MTDYIDRQTAMDVFESLADEDWNKNTGTTWANAFIEVAGMIDGIPPADVRPVVRSHWKKNDNGTYSCERCQSWIPEEQRHYANWCLYCGADMKEETDG